MALNVAQCKTTDAQGEIVRRRGHRDARRPRYTKAITAERAALGHTAAYQETPSSGSTATRRVDDGRGRLRPHVPELYRRGGLRAVQLVLTTLFAAMEGCGRGARADRRSRMPRWPPTGDGAVAGPTQRARRRPGRHVGVLGGGAGVLDREAGVRARADRVRLLGRLGQHRQSGFAFLVLLAILAVCITPGAVFSFEYQSGADAGACRQARESAPGRGEGPGGARRSPPPTSRSARGDRRACRWRSTALTASA